MKHPSQQLLQVMTLNNSPGPYDDNYYKVQFKIACLAGAEGGVGKSGKREGGLFPCFAGEIKSDSLFTLYTCKCLFCFMSDVTKCGISKTP